MGIFDRPCVERQFTRHYNHLNSLHYTLWLQRSAGTFSQNNACPGTKYFLWALCVHYHDILQKQKRKPKHKSIRNMNLFLFWQPISDSAISLLNFGMANNLTFYKTAWDEYKSFLVVWKLIHCWTYFMECFLLS